MSEPSIHVRCPECKRADLIGAAASGDDGHFWTGWCPLCKRRFAMHDEHVVLFDSSPPKPETWRDRPPLL